ncbi:MAG: helix-turn-helix domain-containing protein, partial [Myxococcota bacterium]
MGMQQTERGALLPLILETAIRCFEEGGLEALSMRRVAKQMGYTATTLYRYVENKEALIFALVEEGFARFRVALHAAMSAHQEVRTRLWALGRAYLDFAVHEPVYYRLMFMERCDLTMRGLDPEQDA